MILLAALALSQVDPIALGRARADFGEIPNSGKWKFVFTGQFSPTMILFPAGRADMRFYLVPLSAGGYRLCRQSKVEGVINRDWMLEVGGKRGIFAGSSRGVLYELIAGYKLPKGLSKEVLEDLESSRSYAVYVPQSGGPPRFSYCRFGEVLFLRDPAKLPPDYPKWEIPELEKKLLPRTKNPYPVTPGELEDIKNGFVRIKN